MTTADSNTTEVLIKLFALACKSDHESRAIELCHMMDTDAIQLAIQYASKIRRMQLASKISQLASQKQDEEEERQRLQSLRRSPSPQASVDLFAPSQSDNYDMDSEDFSLEPETNAVNPFLAAKLKKESGLGGSKGSIRKNTQMSEGQKGSNPFAKKSGSGLTVVPSSQPQQPTGSIRSGLVFDDMSKREVGGGGASSKPKFGSTVGVKPSNASLSKTPESKKQTSLLTLKKNAAAATEKENKAKNSEATATASTPLKGFQLWLEENKASLSQSEGISDETELQSLALTVSP